MKFIASISFQFLLLLVFTTAPTAHAWACGGKDKCAKETTEHKSKCQKECCKKAHPNSKKNKKSCCGDNCNCSVSITVMADLPTQLPLSMSPDFCSIFVEKRAFIYKNAVLQSTIQDIWQPPMA
jgi:hypothetical protein